MEKRLQDISEQDYSSHELAYCVINGHNYSLQKINNRMYRTCSQCGALKYLIHKDKEEDAS